MGRPSQGGPGCREESQELPFVPGLVGDAFLTQPGVQLVVAAIAIHGMLSRYLLQ
jgi:hypothetical protein